METQTQTQLQNKKEKAVKMNISQALFEIQRKQLVVSQSRKTVTKDGTVLYANLDDTLEVALPALIENGILYTAYTNDSKLISRFLHVESNTQLETSLDIGAPASNIELAARISVIKRYHLRSVLNIRGEDLPEDKKNTIEIIASVPPSTTEDITVEIDENEPFSEALQTALKYVEGSSNKDVLTLTKTQVQNSTKLLAEEKAYVIKKIDAKLNQTS